MDGHAQRGGDPEVRSDVQCVAGLCCDHDVTHLAVERDAGEVGAPGRMRA